MPKKQMKPRKMREPGWRRDASARVMCECVPELALAGRGLVVGDEVGSVERAVAAAGAEVSVWRRSVMRHREARAWPEDGPFDFAVLRHPTGREAFLMALHAAAARLKPGGRLIVYGANDEGIRSAGNHIEPLFGAAGMFRTKWHCRVLEATLAEAPAGLKGELADWRCEFTADLPDGELRWASWPGVFAHGRIDPGTRHLLGCLPRVKPAARVLDFGCGVGILSAVIRRRLPEAAIAMLDSDAVALEAAKENVPAPARSWATAGTTSARPGMI